MFVPLFELSLSHADVVKEEGKTPVAKPALLFGHVMQI